jgi:hypothetical protein
MDLELLENEHREARAISVIMIRTALNIFILTRREVMTDSGSYMGRRKKPRIYAKKPNQ